MHQRNDAVGRNRDAEPKFYAPASGTPPFGTRRLERLWVSLFDRDGETRG
ncbi:hypothetical protein [Halorubrum vacuolatum]|uniref:Uncharacterized protein n=1 Tax=Halorubrum vacuolatum TaxID=63740 RepID=A0A238UU53_HALVU|nr:hypothetical protein [Halorubrum vacuolatum]SNR25257.1 hypothetical protein SAMN06264855_101346 [Halorubrum vacuolatum]